MGSLAKRIQQIDPVASAPTITDPRPDLAEDSELWTRLLALAEVEDRMLAGALHGFRCQGTRIKRGRSGYVLRPDIDPTGNLAWSSLEEYEEAKRKYLVSRKEEIRKCLQMLP